MKKVQVCSYCQSPDHTSVLCWSKPRTPIASSQKLIAKTPLKRSTKPIPKVGKVTKEWLLTRLKWARIDAGGRKEAELKIWKCHYCGKNLVLRKDHFYFIDGLAEVLTLDHIKPRSSHPNLRADLDNIVPCCVIDNKLKGSTSYESFCAKYYPHLIENKL